MYEHWIFKNNRKEKHQIYDLVVLLMCELFLTVEYTVIYIFSSNTFH